MAMELIGQLLAGMLLSLRTLTPRGAERYQLEATGVLPVDSCTFRFSLPEPATAFSKRLSQVDFVGDGCKDPLDRSTELLEVDWYGLRKQFVMEAFSLAAIL